MQYYVLGTGGEKYGPATIDELNQWATEGRVNAYSMVSTDDSSPSVPITSLPGFKTELVATTPPSQSFQAAPQMYAGKIENYLVKSILVTLFCCMPLGIVSIVFAAQVDGHVRSGNYAAAEDASKKANLFSNISLGIGLAFTLMYAIFMIFAVLSGQAR